MRILRPGDLAHRLGTVLFARSGYYQVKLAPPTEGSTSMAETGSTIFFRGKELWLTADGAPPPPSALAPPRRDILYTRASASQLPPPPPPLIASPDRLPPP